MEVSLRPRPTRMAAMHRSVALTLVVVATVSLFGIVPKAIGQKTQSSAQPVALDQHQEDASFTNYKFRDGETLPQLRIHYTTLGRPHKNAEGTVDNAILLLHWTNASSQALLVPEYKEALFAPGAALDATRLFVIIPDSIGLGQSSKPSDGLKASFPHYGYGDMVDLQYRLVTKSLRLTHLRAVIGMSMGCMNAWQWAEDYPDAMDGIMPVACFPAPVSGRNLLWRRVLVDGIKSDPVWSNGNYTQQPPSVAAGLELARMMIDGVPHLQEEVTSIESADAFLRGVKNQSARQDANDLLYSFESSRDFNAEPNLGKIRTKVFALNFADDEFYRDSLQILQRDMLKVDQGKVVIRAVSAGSAGHFSMSHPDLWKDQVKDFIEWVNSR